MSRALTNPPKFVRQEGDPAVIPPTRHDQLAGHHWLRVKDSDGHFFGFICLQWQPRARQWCHSFMYATGRNYDVSYYEYWGPCPMPADPEEIEELKKLIRAMDSLDNTEAADRRVLTNAQWKLLRSLTWPMLP